MGRFHRFRVLTWRWLLGLPAMVLSGGLASSCADANTPTAAEARPPQPTVAERIEVVRARAAELRDQDPNKPSANRQVAQWYNFPNWNNWSDWPNGWYNY